ncbi:hypothetical protein PROFUN_03075 [Planoprotostelium fungivorum]|uniref:Transmembrane protein n=1 Tax=Planoprotostelium fungivorum TaxID=1890364 RepID=A0A2P6NQB0_9EUKA|nr:hypothetical protein PROFUN_03075 [Planoprotostelium fungivorum]
MKLGKSPSSARADGSRSPDVSLNNIEIDDLERQIQAELDDDQLPSRPSNVARVEAEEPATQLTYSAYLDLKKKSFSVQIFCLLDFAISLYSLIFRKAWYTGLGVLIAVIGFWGARTYRRQFVTIYLLYILLDLFLEMIYVARWSEETLAVVLSVLIMGIRSVTGIFVFQFHKLMPLEGAKAFNSFTTTSNDIPMTAM